MNRANQSRSSTLPPVRSQPRRDPDRQSNTQRVDRDKIASAVMVIAKVVNMELEPEIVEDLRGRKDSKTVDYVIESLTKDALFPDPAGFDPLILGFSTGKRASGGIFYPAHPYFVLNGLGILIDVSTKKPLAGFLKANNVFRPISAAEAKGAFVHLIVNHEKSSGTLDYFMKQIREETIQRAQLMGYKGKMDVADETIEKDAQKRNSEHKAALKKILGKMVPRDRPQFDSIGAEVLYVQDYREGQRMIKEYAANPRLRAALAHFSRVPIKEEPEEGVVGDPDEDGMRDASTPVATRRNLGKFSSSSSSSSSGSSSSSSISRRAPPIAAWTNE